METERSGVVVVAMIVGMVTDSAVEVEHFGDIEMGLVGFSVVVRARVNPWMEVVRAKLVRWV